jgi:hypothetical protein
MITNDRMVKIGDLVLEKESMFEKPKWIGVVHDIKYDDYGHGTAFLTWTPEPPPRYNKRYGYSCTNIHNSRHSYDVIKNEETKIKSGRLS